MGHSSASGSLCFFCLLMSYLSMFMTKDAQTAIQAAESDVPEALDYLQRFCILSPRQLSIARFACTVYFLLTARKIFRKVDDDRDELVTFDQVHVLSISTVIDLSADCCHQSHHEEHIFSP
jgi:hypothetical protein